MNRLGNKLVSLIGALMKKGMITGVLLLVGSAACLALPLARNVIASYQMRNTENFEATCIRYENQARTVGPVRLNENQRKQLIEMLDWDYILWGKSLRGFPSCMSTEALEFKAFGSSGSLLHVLPHCETAGFTGLVSAGGWSPGSRRGWEILRDDLFPEEQKHK